MVPEPHGPPHGPSVQYNGQQKFAPKDSMTGAELYQFFQVPPNHRLYRESKGNQPDEPIQNDGVTRTIKNGDRFYDLPQGQFGAPLPRVVKELEDLKGAYGAQQVQVREEPDGSMHITIADVAMPAHWTKPQARIRFIVPPSYPQGKPDGFFTDKDLLLKSNNGAGAGGGDATLPPDNAPWKKFCWQPKAWDMSRETLLRYAKFCEARFQEAQ